MSNVGVTVRLHDVEESFTIRGELFGQHGISFDTGMDHTGVVEWFLDWSLKYGPEIENRDEAINKIKEVLDKHKLEYSVRIESYED
tara:strand:- start:8 stop:265 length:258 start_codon:yes stop_codon:yes gene_type:complete